MHTHTHISVSLNKPSYIRLMPKMPSRKLPIQQHGLAKVLQTYSSFFFCSGFADFFIVTASVFSGFNSLNMMVGPFFPLLTLAFVFQAVFLRACFAVIFRIGPGLLGASDCAHARWVLFHVPYGCAAANSDNVKLEKSKQ